MRPLRACFPAPERNFEPEIKIYSSDAVVQRPRAKVTTAHHHAAGRQLHPQRDTNMFAINRSVLPEVRGWKSLLPSWQKRPKGPSGVRDIRESH